MRNTHDGLVSRHRPLHGAGPCAAGDAGQPEAGGETPGRDAKFCLFAPATTHMSRHGISTEECFWAKVEPEPNSGCWLWIGATSNKSGHGRMWSQEKRRLIYPHRFSYELFRGPIPLGLTIDHLCRITCCVNPNHLEVVTRRENVRRMPQYHRLLKTTCPKGHIYQRDKQGHVRCRICHRSTQQRYVERQQHG